MIALTSTIFFYQNIISGQPLYVSFDFQLGNCDYWQGPDGNWYRHVAQKATFDKAREICFKDTPGAQLMAIKSQETADFLEKFIKAQGLEGQEGRYWLGATDEVREGNFTWIDGYGNYENLTFTSWADNEPNDHGMGEDCATTV